MATISKFYDVIDGRVLRGATIIQGGYVDVGQRSSAVNTVVKSGGYMTVEYGQWGGGQGGGTVVDTTISNGGTVYLQATGNAPFMYPIETSTEWSSASGIKVLNGGRLILDHDASVNGVSVARGGTIVLEGNGTKGMNIAAGAHIIQARLTKGMTAHKTVVSGFSQYVLSGGTSIAAKIVAASETIYSHGVASRTVVQSGGFQNIEKGGSAFATTLDQGFQIDQGVASKTVIAANGVQTISKGGRAEGVIVSSGGTEVLRVDGTANNVTVLSGGTIDLEGGAVSGLVVRKGGRIFHQTVQSGDKAHDEIVASGMSQTILAGGTASGGIVTGNQTIANGGTAIGITLSGSGLQQDNGLAERTTIVAKGEQFVLKTAIATTLSSGALQNIAHHGVASRTIVSNGGEQVMGSGGRSEDAVVYAGGTQIVARLGEAIGTRVSSGGFENVSGGTIVDTMILSGGTLSLSFYADVEKGLTVRSGGTVNVGYLATLSGFTASKGVTLVLDTYGSASQTVLDGGTEILDGGTAVGSVAFRGGHSTLVDTKEYVAPISATGFSSGDEIDLRAFTSPRSGTLSFSENAAKTKGVLTITDGNLSAQITLLGQYTAAGFHLAAATGGGTAITYSNLPAVETELAAHPK